MPHIYEIADKKIT